MRILLFHRRPPIISKTLLGVPNPRQHTHIRTRNTQQPIRSDGLNCRINKRGSRPIRVQVNYIDSVRGMRVHECVGIGTGCLDGSRGEGVMCDVAVDGLDCGGGDVVCEDGLDGGDFESVAD